MVTNTYYDNNHSSDYEDLGLGYSNKASSLHPHDDTLSNEDVPESGFSFHQQPCLDTNNTNERCLSDSLHDASQRQRFIQDLLNIAAPALESHDTQSVDTGTITPTGMPSNEVTHVDYSHILDVLTNNNNTSSHSHHLGAGNFPDNNYTTSPFANTTGGFTSRRVDANHLTNDQWQQQHYSENDKLPHSQYKMASNPPSKRLSLGISLGEVEALLNLENIHTKTNSLQKHRRCSTNFLEPLLSCMQSHTSLSQLFHSQDDERSSNKNNFMDMKDKANASFDNFSPHVVTPTCSRSKQPSLLSSLLDQFNDQEIKELGSHFISDMDTDLDVSHNYGEVISSVPLPPINSTDHHEVRSSPVPSSQLNSINPLDMKSPFVDVSFATKYRTNLKALVSRMEQTSKSRNGLEEVKRHLNYCKKVADTTPKKEKLDIHGGEMNNPMTAGSISTTSTQHYPHHYQPSAPLSYTAIKHSRRQQKSKKKRVCSPTKSSQVTMKKKKLSNVNHRTHNRSFSLKLCTPENIFG